MENIGASFTAACIVGAPWIERSAADASGTPNTVKAAYARGSGNCLLVVSIAIRVAWALSIPCRIFL
jgi:hypothetical protein